MALPRSVEENEISPDLRRVYADIRKSFDVPLVPTIFKVSASVPEYLRLVWSDLGEVARSREFQSATRALEEYAYSQVLSGDWRMNDQHKAMAGQGFSSTDMDMLGAVVSTFSRITPQMALFSRLMQLGYSGGQSGKVSDGKQASALSRMISLHVPGERDIGLRTWLIYSDIKKTTGCKHVFSLFRLLSPYPGYLASVWIDAKRLFQERSFLRARDEVMARSRALLTGLPVGDHRHMARNITPNQWRDIEESMDNFVRLMPQFVLFNAIWQRSFARMGNFQKVA
ncbi:MAG TPA: halocarboxylic acid dehydrogenase DehI family protein [Terriglobales bacterium]|nr:halocarboxylic acid dehydrogenase DehI family protein [Terriglobales bacterium]